MICHQQKWGNYNKHLTSDEARRVAATIAKIQEVVNGYPGLQRDLLTYLKERIKEVLSGAGATIVVRTFGPDMAVLRPKAEEIKKAADAYFGSLRKPTIQSP